MRTEGDGKTLVLENTELAQLQVQLGLGTEDNELVLHEGAVPLDLNPYLNDLCVGTLSQLGHHDIVPRSYDWENLLALIEPGEELLWIVDYSRHDDTQGMPCFSVRIGMRFGGGGIGRPQIPEERRHRFQAFLSQFRRQAFPESKARVHDPEAVWSVVSRNPAGHGARTFCVTGAPSPKDLRDDQVYVERDQEQRSYQSINDVVETCLGLETSFRLVFVVGRLSEGDLAEEFHRVTSLRGAIHPYVRAQEQETSSQALTSQGQVGANEQTGGSQKGADALALPTVKKALNLGAKPVNWAGRLFGSSQDFAQLKDAKPTSTWSKTETWSHSHSRAETEGTAVTRESLRSDLELAEATLERYAASLYEARGTGGYQGAVFIQAQGESAEVIASSVRGVLAGSQSKDHPLSVFEIRGPASSLLQTSWPTLPMLAPAPPVLSIHQACQLLLLPEAELPGLALHHSVFFGRNASPPQEKERGLVSLGPDAFMTDHRNQGQIQVPANDLFRHVLVAGTTGSGKTYRTLRILEGLANLEDLRVVVFETAKRTYRGGYVRSPVSDALVYTLGQASHPEGSRFRPLRINPFYFEQGTSLKRHVSVLSEALAELLPTEAMIGPKMREAVERCYADLGWDIERGEWTGEGPQRYPCPLDFVVHVRRIAEELNYGPEVSANYRGALEARARVFTDATFQDIFSHGGNVPVREMFPRDSIIEFEELPPSEIDIPAFVMTLLLSRLRAVQIQELEARRRGEAAEGDDHPGGWLLVVEEAHNVLNREREAQQDSRESNAGRLLLESFVRLLQEGRELRIGVMVIDQSPAMLARSVIKNTNTKVVMRLEDGAEMEELGQTLGLEEQAWRNLGVLQQGEAIVKAGYMTRPVKSCPYPEREGRDPEGYPHDATMALAPSYIRLEEQWSGVLRGADEPDEAWLENLKTSTGHVEVAAYACRKALIGLAEDALLGSEPARELFEGLGDPDLTWEGLRGLADGWFKRERARHSVGNLLLLERRLLAASVAHPRPPKQTIGVVVTTRTVWLAASVLAARFGSEEAWRTQLGRLAVASGEAWVTASSSIRDHITDVSAEHALGPSVLLRSYAAVIGRHPVTRAILEDRFDPVKVAALAGLLVEEAGCAWVEPDADPVPGLDQARGLIQGMVGLSLVSQLAPEERDSFRALVIC